MLTYHHFDPPWAGNFIHNPQGMIALCPLHHNQADGGMWSKEQLRQMKRHPYVDDALRVQWPWQSETLVMKVGRSLVIGSGSPIRLRGRPAMHFRPALISDLGVKTVTFDSDVRDKSGQPWLRIEDGWFDLRLMCTTDVVFTPQHRSLLARHGDDTFLSLRYEKVPADKFGQWASTFIDDPAMLEGIPSSIESVRAIDSDGNVSVMTFEGQFSTKEVSLSIRGDKMLFELHVPGTSESIEWSSWIVDSERRAIIRLGKGPEIFSLG